jgi:hypothetical protein
MIKTIGGRAGGGTLIAWAANFAAPQLFVSSWLFEDGQMEAIATVGWIEWLRSKSCSLDDIPGGMISTNLEVAREMLARNFNDFLRPLGISFRFCLNRIRSI